MASSEFPLPPPIVFGPAFSLILDPNLRLLLLVGCISSVCCISFHFSCLNFRWRCPHYLCFSIATHDNILTSKPLCYISICRFMKWKCGVRPTCSGQDIVIIRLNRILDRLCNIRSKRAVPNILLNLTSRSICICVPMRPTFLHTFVYKCTLLVKVVHRS